MVKTTCAYCGVGCGILATPTGERTATIAGDADHPANRGRLCSKGTHLGETLSLEGRLLYPEIDGRRASWDKAIRHVARKFADTIARQGPDSVAFYVSGQLLTEDYYVANKLMKGFIGSGNVDTNSRLCMASSVAGHKRAFGADTVPGSYEDLDAADLIVLVGSNAAWCHPVLFQRMVRNRRERGARIVVIDPRRTATAEDADGAIAAAERHEPHLALVDLHLANGSTGFAVAARLHDLDVPCLFVSGKAPSFAMPDLALGCLMKPFTAEDVHRAIGLAEDRLRGRDSLRIKLPLNLHVYDQAEAPVEAPGFIPSRRSLRTRLEHWISARSA